MSNNVSRSFVGLEKVEQSESIICQSRRQREIIDIDLQDTDKIRISFSITEFNMVQ